MVHKPKRRKYKDNPYVIERINGVNFISFKDSNNRLQIVEVNTKVYEVFDESELHDLSQMHKDEAHIDFRSIDNTEKMDNILFQSSNAEYMNIPEEVEKNVENDILRDAINELSEVQKRRIKKYYFEDKTVYQIAEEENATHQAISKSLKQAIEKLQKILKK